MRTSNLTKILMSDPKENIEKLVKDTQEIMEAATSQIAKVCVIRNRLQKTPINKVLSEILRDIRNVSREKTKYVGKTWDEKVALAKKQPGEQPAEQPPKQPADFIRESRFCNQQNNQQNNQQKNTLMEVIK